MKLIFSLDRDSHLSLEGKEFQLPVTEVVMLDAATKKEADGAFEELVGNLSLYVAFKVYEQLLMLFYFLELASYIRRRRSL